MAERVGFEPTRAFTLPVFKTGAVNRLATSPRENSGTWNVSPAGCIQQPLLCIQHIERQYYIYIEQARAGADENLARLGANTGTGRCVSAREP
jgi:hypothetical protein